MARDPVCGMEVDPQSAAARAPYNGVTFYFCSLGCKEQFERTPAVYAQRAETGETAPMGGEGARPAGYESAEEERPIIEERPIMRKGVDVIEGHGPETISEGVDVIQGHGPETISEGVDVIERGEPGGAG